MHVDKITSRICSYTPESPTPGQLVVICSWMDAQEKHLSRYIQLHHEISPGARILLVQSSAAMLVSPYAWQRAALKPAVQYIIDNALIPSCILRDLKQQTQKTHQLSKKKIDTNSTNILLHSFSNGGGLTATQILFLLREATHMPLPLVGVVLDSSPNGGGYAQTHHAIVVSQPKSQRAMVSLLAHAALLPKWVIYATGHKENSQEVMRKTFLDSEYMATTNVSYVYSKDDQITNWKDVHLHAEEARAKGWHVDENLLESSPHCGHIRTQGEMYAAVVKRIWNRVERQSRL